MNATGLRHIQAPEGVAPSDGYTHVVTGPGRLVALAGQMPFDEKGEFVGEGDPTAQARQVFANMRGCLAAAGATFKDVVKLTYYVTDVAHIPAILSARDEFIDLERPPASTVVQVVALYRPELLMEIDAFAIVGESTAPTVPTAPPGARTGPPPPLDRELAAPLRSILGELPMPLTPALISDRRDRSAASRLTHQEIRGDGAFEIEERTVPGRPGSPGVPLLICRPTATAGPHPLVYHTHGGGMVAGSNRSTELVGELARAKELQLAVVAVDYRLAPEHPDPVPVEDCYAGLVWVAEHAAELGLDPDRIIVSGNSAGGALAAGLALLARDRGGPRLLGQLLQFPMLDDRCDSASAAQLERAGLWDGASNRAGWTALLGDRRGTDQVSCYAAPARAGDLFGLPPAFIEVGSVEALRDDGISYASRIWREGGEAELHVWSGAFHSFDEWVPGAVVSRTAHRTRISWLRRVLGHRARPLDEAAPAAGLPEGASA
ncbi:alpha/beta hydrolase fold domain-containing protein [Streptomyces canus]|uniref:alpha/beta hydrolase fold domain-containing protein n=1 Tax=Streptomyces canus TaxID=58343 RepID=UPI003870AEB2